jgi:chromate transporter
MTDSALPGDRPAGRQPTLFELFRAFALVSISGFGAALPWARRMVVEQRRWMTPDEFNEAFSLSQFLPGPNTVNFSVVFGSRFGGLGGAIVALVGLLGPPVFIVTVLAALYARYGDLAALTRVLGGIASAAAGLLIANVVKMAEPLLRKRDFGPPIAIAGFVAVALMRWPLPYVFLVLAPVSVALAFLRMRK